MMNVERQLPKYFSPDTIPYFRGDWEAFAHAIFGVSYRAANKNIQKALNLDHQQYRPVEWCNTGYYLGEQESVTWDPFFQAGAYYVQDPSTLFLSHILRQIIQADRDYTVLDMCAAPGGKTTQLLNSFSSDSLIVANELMKNRYSVLKQNIIKWSCPNILLSSSSPENFERLENYFDVVVVDAPCSGEGMFGKSVDAVQHWSPSLVRSCAVKQKAILASAHKTLKPGGLLIYSTCTYNQTENTDIVQSMITDYGYHCINNNIELPNDNIVDCKGLGFQFFPHLVNGDGFFISVLQKDLGLENKFMDKRGKGGGLKNNASDWSIMDKESYKVVESFLPKIAITDLLMDKEGNVRYFNGASQYEWVEIKKGLSFIEAGLLIGKIIRNQFVPEHPLALNPLISTFEPKWELSKKEVIEFLQKKQLENFPDAHGWHIVKHAHLGLGWAKLLGNRYNNYIPKEWRIRDDEQDI